MNYFKIKCWIPTESEIPEIFNDRDNAFSECSNLEFLQPENIYGVIPCDKNGEEYNE